MTTHTTTQPSREWALKVLHQLGYTTRPTPFGTLAHRPGFSLMLKNNEDLGAFAEQEAV